LDREPIDLPPGLLRATPAARRLGLSTKELLRLAYERRIRDVVVEGIAHFRPVDLKAYEEKGS
jgi:hypothetical protein